jgi:hydrogenase-4 component B
MLSADERGSDFRDARARDAIFSNAMTVIFLLSVPVLLIGVTLALALRSNPARALAAIASQATATGLVLVSLTPTLRGGSPLEIVWPWPKPINSIAFRVDALGAFFLVWSLPMTLLGTVYAVGYLRPYFQRGRNGGSHFALLNLVSLSFVLIYSVENALVFLLAWEIAAIAAWLLVIWDYSNQKIRFAGFNYLVSTHVGLFVLVAAFMLLHSETRSMDFAAFGKFLAQPSALRGTIFLLLGVSFALKSAFFPFHTWLPRAHSAAPAHVSALMSGVIHKAGLFAFLRFTLLMGKPEEWMGWGVLSFGLVSAFFGILYTTTQRDLKRLLGYSSTENVGIAAVGFGIGYLGWSWGIPTLTVCGFAGGLLHLFNHALFKCLLFYAAGSVYRATHTVDIERLGGLAKRLPATTALFLVGAIAIAALPPLNGFVSELIVYSALLSGSAPSDQGNVLLICYAAVLAFVGGLGALSMTRAFGLTFLGTPRDTAVHVGSEAPFSMWLPMALHALGVVLFGLAPQLALAAIWPALKLFSSGTELSVLASSLAPLSVANPLLAGAFVLAGGLAWLRGRRAKRSATWACGYTAPSARMQYTASSFSDQLARLLRALLPSVRREDLPQQTFPRRAGHLGTHHFDPVERRTFEMLGQAEDLVAHASERIPEQSRFAFAAGLVALVIIGALVLGGSSR